MERAIDRALLLGSQLSAILDRAKQLYDPTPSTEESTPALSSLPSAIPPRTDSTSSSPIQDADEEQEIITLDASSKQPPSDSPSTNTLPSLSVPSATTEDDLDNSPLSPRSPIESQSRTLTLEEGEVFRKGSVAIGEREMDDDELGDVSGEDLKKEVCLSFLFCRSGG